MDSIFVWTLNDVLGLIFLGVVVVALTGFFLWDSIHEKVNKFRNRRR